MSEEINVYGDHRIATQTGHGIDVASQRADDLDRMAIAHIKTLVAQQQRVYALDAGCGHGGQAARMAQAGAYVQALDSEDYEAQVAHAMLAEGIQHGYVFQRVSVETHPWIGPCDVIVCQRMIHYLKRNSARDVLFWFRCIAQTNAKLYLSASGMDSELGEGYAGSTQPVHKRFAQLSPKMAKKHAIYPPVCLYRLDELSALVREAGWVVENAFLSEFGNVKIVARKERPV